MSEKIRYLHAYGDRKIVFSEIDKPSCPDNGVLVKTIMTGVCRSDVAQYLGDEKGVPFGMFGHEGLGEVVEIGKDCHKPGLKIGSIVSTWSDPAYADYYPAKMNEFVIVPEAAPKYILQPVACAINILMQTIKFMERMDLVGEEILLLGTGFMSTIIGDAAKARGIDMTIVGRANTEKWDSLGFKRYDTSAELCDEIKNKTRKNFSVVIDLSSKEENFYAISETLAGDEALICYAGTPMSDVKTNFFANCWKCHTLIMPSPRNRDFNDSMAESAKLIEAGVLDTDKLWTCGYTRDVEADVILAFEDGSDRTPDYIRGYISW